MTKTILPLGLLAAAMCSCGPTVYNFNVDRSAPSASEMNFTGKSMSFVYEAGSDSLVAAELALGFVSSMEEQYFAGNDAVPVYNRLPSQGAAAAPKDTMVDMIMESGSDVVFFLHGVKTGETAYANSVVRMPFTAVLSVYDSMDSRDTVVTCDASDAFVWQVAPGTELSEIEDAVKADVGNAAFRYGRSLSESFLPVWIKETYSLVIYEYDSEWYEAAAAAVGQMDWKNALSVWMRKADTGDIQKRSCAAYNCALACYMLEEYDLALQWLDLSDSVMKLSYSKSLRSRIAERQGLSVK